MESLFQKNKTTNRFSSSAELHSWVFLKQISSGLVQPEKDRKRRAQYFLFETFFFSILPTRKLVSQEFARTEHVSLENHD